MGDYGSNSQFPKKVHDGAQDDTRPRLFRPVRSQPADLHLAQAFFDRHFYISAILLPYRQCTEQSSQRRNQHVLLSIFSMNCAVSLRKSAILYDFLEISLLNVQRFGLSKSLRFVDRI